MEQSAVQCWFLPRTVRVCYGIRLPLTQYGYEVKVGNRTVLP